jgi:murein DD-endopeptidase MepM/ murein hydrolase activator NlpD
VRYTAATNALDHSLTSASRIENPLPSYDQVYIELFGHSLNVAAPLQPDTDWTPAFRRPYDGYIAANSFLDHITSGDGKTTRADNLAKTGTLSNCTLGVSCYDGHDAIDYNTGTGPIKAAGTGTIEAAGWSHDDCGGYYKDALRVIISHSNGFKTRYWHLSSLGTNPRTNQQWAAGDTIYEGEHVGNSGTTGCSSGNHLHFDTQEISSGDHIDPYGWWGNSDRYGNDRYQPLYKSSSDGKIVSESSSGFERFAHSGWSDAGGDGGYAYYTLSQGNSNYINWGMWWANLSTSGLYEVKVYIPSGAEATSVQYKILHS